MHFYFLGYGLNRFVNGSFYRLSIETAVRIYYEYNAIGNKQICELFGCCIGKAQQLKKPVAAAMLEQKGIKTTEDELKVLLEAAVKEMNDKFNAA